MAESTGISSMLDNQQRKPFLFLDKRTIGLDPVFRSCVKIKIKDFNELQLVDIQDSGKPDANIELYCFMNHVVNKVEVMGIVVMVDNKEQRNSFAVDDGTGVVLCIQWKNTRNAPKTELDEGDLPTSLAQKYRELQTCNRSKQDGFDLGDLVQVRGWITTFRDQREIFVLDCRKIDNPCLEIDEVLEYPSLYKFYKKAFVPPLALAQWLEGMSANAFNEIAVQDAITRYIEDSGCSQTTVTPHDVLLWPTIKAIMSGLKEGDQENHESYLNVIKSSLCCIEKTKGSIYQLQTTTETYEIIRSDCPMAVRVMSLLKSECQTGNNAENGCHIRQLKANLAKLPKYSTVSDSIMFYLLSCLENTSDAICLNPHRYIPAC